MTTTRRVLIDLLRRKRWAQPGAGTPIVNPHTYFAEIAMGNRELDATEAMRAVDLTSLENFASQSLGPIDPRIIGRRSDGTAIFR